MVFGRPKLSPVLRDLLPAPLPDEAQGAVIRGAALVLVVVV